MSCVYKLCVFVSAFSLKELWVVSTFLNLYKVVLELSSGMYTNKYKNKKGRNRKKKRDSEFLTDSANQITWWQVTNSSHRTVTVPSKNKNIVMCS